MGEKINSSFQVQEYTIVLLKFVTRIDGWSKPLFSDSVNFKVKSLLQCLTTDLIHRPSLQSLATDLATEVDVTGFVKGCNHIKVPKGEHLLLET